MAELLQLLSARDRTDQNTNLRLSLQLELGRPSRDSVLDWAATQARRKSFENLCAGIFATVVFSRYGGSETLSLERRTDIIGSFVRSHSRYAKSQKFGDAMRRIIALMGEPDTKITFQDMRPLTKPLGIARERNIPNL